MDSDYIKPMRVSIKLNPNYDWMGDAATSEDAERFVDALDTVAKAEFPDIVCDVSEGHREQDDIFLVWCEDEETELEIRDWLEGAGSDAALEMALETTDQPEVL